MVSQGPMGLLGLERNVQINAAPTLFVPSSPHQRAFVYGACIGTAKVGVSLVSLLDPLFTRSRLHCLCVYLT